MSKHILIHMISLSVDFYYIRNICPSLYQYIHSGILQIQRLNRFLTLKIDLLPHYFRQRQFVPPMCLIVQMQIGYASFTASHNDTINFRFPAHYPKIIILSLQLLFRNPFF